MTGQFHWKAAPACSCEAAACGGPSGKGTQSPPWWAPRGHDLPGTWWELRRRLLSGRKEGGRGRGGALATAALAPLAGTRHPAPDGRAPRCHEESAPPVCRPGPASMGIAGSGDDTCAWCLVRPAGHDVAEGGSHTQTLPSLVG